MKSHYRVVVIGGGVIGASVLFHLSKFGWSEIALVERDQLTAGSTWHAAAGFHAINADPNIAALQSYTIHLYRALQEETGADLGMHTTGGVDIAGTAERWEWLKAAWAVYRTMGVDTELISPDEIKRICPIVDVSNVFGGLYDPSNGHLDPHSVTHMYTRMARKRGADVVLHNRVLELVSRPDGSWHVVTEQGTITAEHVVNAGGLWARKVGMMAGVDLPVAPLEHHYLVTEAIPEVEALKEELPSIHDLEGFTYSRQEHNGLLLGVYELNPKHWHIEGAPWSFSLELLPEDIDRIAPELEKGFARYPCLQTAGIKRWVNGPFTFTPDGNPLVGPVPGMSNYWVACGVMAGFSQGGGVGLALAQWMIEGEPAMDVFGMDVARYGRFACNHRYLKAKTREFYSRRFLVTYPNEQLPAGRPLRVSPAHDALEAEGACFGETWGLEVPRYFDPGKRNVRETPTMRHSNAFPMVEAEARTTRACAGLLDTSAFARYKVSGVGARDWLDKLLACNIPGPGRLCLAPMLSPSGRLMGDLTVIAWGDDCFWIMGSYHLRRWHMRWFDAHMPACGVSVRDVSDAITGFALSGPRAREILAALTPEDISGDTFSFMSCREMDVGIIRAKVARLSITGELGYEINVPAAEHLTLYRQLADVGKKTGLINIGFNAIRSLRMEKGFGAWSTEFTWAGTPGMSGLDRFVAFDKGDFIGREAALAERDEAPPRQRLITLEIESEDADASGFEPVWAKGNRVGYITSGAYGHCARKNLAMAYLDQDVIHDDAGLDVHVVGTLCKARILREPAIDPTGARMRS